MLLLAFGEEHFGDEIKHEGKRLIRAVPEPQGKVSVLSPISPLPVHLHAPPQLPLEDKDAALKTGSHFISAEVFLFVFFCVFV